MAHRHNGVRFRISCFILDTRYLPSETPKVVANSRSFHWSRSLPPSAFHCALGADLDLDGGLIGSARIGDWKIRRTL